MVSRTYLVARKPPPSAMRTFIDQKLFPVAIDSAGTLEMAAEWIAVLARRTPLTTLGTVFGLGTLAGYLAWKRK
jgi:hypothetical protein